MSPPPSFQGRLANLPLDGQGRLRLPSVPGGGVALRVRAWVRATRPGRLALTGLLLCPAPLPATVEMVFEEPFEFRCVEGGCGGRHVRGEEGEGVRK